MPKFLYVYHGGGMPETAEEQAKAMKAWTEWFAGLGASVIDGGNPVGKSSTVSAGGAVSANGGANPASGYSLINATNLDDAIAKARGCPILHNGGSVEVAETIEM